MKPAWTLHPLMIAACLTMAGRPASANESGHSAHAKHDAPASEEPHAEVPAKANPEAAGAGIVMAMDAERARPIRQGELITSGSKTLTFVTRENFRAELSPHSVAEFDEQGMLRLLRGSLVAESKEEASMRTAGARLEFIGRSLLSYDHKAKSTSAFVLEGEARLVNPHRGDSSLRLPRYRGATLELGEVVPQLVRQLDVGSVDDWMKGYAWPAERRAALLKGIPGRAVTEAPEVPKHLEEAKIEDYFSSIDTADEFHQPDYYSRKFDDPDKVVAEQNSAAGASKVLTPEEAALISLPKTQIDLGFDLGPEVISPEQKRREVAQIGKRKFSSRAPASVRSVAKPKKRKNSEEAESGDPDVALVLSRLRQVRGDKSVISQTPADSRAPASVSAPVVPDPVYDYSQNF